MLTAVIVTLGISLLTGLVTGYLVRMIKQRKY